MTRKAYDYALDLLSARAYTIRNLRRKLIQREYAADDVAQVVERLSTAGLLDDARFAREYARQRLTAGGVAVRRVGQELASKGVGRDEIAGAIELVLDEEEIDPKRAIDIAARKKVAGMGEVEIDKKRRRLFAFLARRGFDVGDIQMAVEQHAPRGAR